MAIELMGPICGLIALVVLMVVYLATRYKRVPPNKLLVIHGSGPGMKKGEASRILHGGAAVIWPLVQSSTFMDLSPMVIHIDLKGALSKQNIRIDVPSTFTIRISAEENTAPLAAENLLNRSHSEIEALARDIIFGQLRLVVAQMDIEAINANRDLFVGEITKFVEKELSKVGLHLLNVNITDIHDSEGYIEAIGRRAAAEATERAKAEVAEQVKIGETSTAEHNKDREIKVAEARAKQDIQVADATASSAIGQQNAETLRRQEVRRLEAEAVEGENTASANIAEYNATLAEKEAEAMRRSEVARRTAEIEVQKAQYMLEQERLRAEEIVREEIQKTQIEIAAEAEAEKQRRIAAGEADAIYARYDAEARGIQAVLEAKAAGYGDLVQRAGGDPGAAATLLLVEKIESMVAAQAEAIKNLKIDQVTVWDSGTGPDGTSSTSRFASSLVQSLPPLMDVAKMAGVDLPAYIGDAKPVAESADEE